MASPNIEVERGTLRTDMLSNFDRGMVGWDGENDKHNPRNYAHVKKRTTITLLGCMIVLSFLPSSILAPAVPSIDIEFDNKSSIISSILTTIYVFGFIIGPLVLSPLSEVYGRRPVLNIANTLFTVTHVGSALSPNIGCLLACRILSGFGGSASFSVGGGILADLYAINERGVPNAVVTTGSLFGPVLGPLIGGIITKRCGWRWIFWILLIACAMITTCIGLFLPETASHVVLRQKTRRIAESTGTEDLQCIYDPRATSTGVPLTLSRVLSRPWEMFCRSPVMVILCLIVGFVSALLYILLTTTSAVFKTSYGWSIELAGLAYIGLGLGSLIGLILFAKTSDSITGRLTHANNNIYQPEFRLVTAFVPALFIPISFFWYGWSTFAHAHWLIPLIGLMPFGFAQVGLNVTAQAYLIDASGPFAASGVACLISSRCLLGGFLPLVGPLLYNKFGLGWGNSMLGFVSLTLVPCPLLLYRYGHKLREMYPLSPKEAPSRVG